MAGEEADTRTKEGNSTRAGSLVSLSDVSQMLGMMTAIVYPNSSLLSAGCGQGTGDGGFLQAIFLP